MKANELQINNFLQAPNVQFVIPVYQRNYDWKNAECNKLLHDIIGVEIIPVRAELYSVHHSDIEHIK